MPKPVGRYVYWSERLVREVIDDNGIQLDPRVKASLKLGVGGGGLDLAGRDREKTTFEVAERLKRKLRRSIVSDFDTSGPLQLVQGASWVEVAEFQGWGYSRNRLTQRTAVVHARTVTAEGQRVDLCLFGGLKNLRGYTIPEDDPVLGWRSSAAPAIEALVASRGMAPSQVEGDVCSFDEEELAVDTLKVALSQGVYRRTDDHMGRPETRAFTVMGFDATEYVAFIYRDVTLTPGRWDFQWEPEMMGTSRILIGAPLWLRTTRPSSIRTYFGSNRVELPPSARQPTAQVLFQPSWQDIDQLPG
ncbi:hypothetical protein [Streptomyces shenzhenensis]|uniref:hypothetical protein n=1 Tax=Streptomyces shenzhenensis TaxID=943815 RepID=UPI001F160F0F|nr:hypothetical protein [Streptomyces shenzhenensis]